MKKILILILLLFSLWSCKHEKKQVDAFKQFYSECKDIDGVMTMNIPGWLVRSFVNDEDPEVNGIIKKVKHLRLVISDDSEVPVSLSSAFKALKREGDYESIMEVRDGKDQIDVMVLRKRDEIQDVVIAVMEESGNLVLVNLNGSFKLEQIKEFVTEEDNVLSIMH